MASQERRGASEARVAVASTADLPVGKGAVYSVNSKPVLVIHTPNGYKALSATCTHLGCEELLQKANTPLIESRALQHTVNLADIEAKAKESLTLSQEVQASAEAALKDLDTRPPGMIVTLAVILVTIVALVPIKLELDRDLERERARQRSGSTAVK